MAQTFTYDQAIAKAQSAGVWDSMSEADKKLMATNPDAGMTIVQAKIDYANATTPEARALANQRAESVRASFGEYTGGGDGAGYYKTQLSPNSFDYAGAPTYTPDSQYESAIRDQYNQMVNYGDYNYGQAAPTWESRYDETKQQLLQDILNREEFSYNPETDQLTQNYQKMYAREGQRAQANALAEAAAMSGGMPSTYAQTAAGQAGDYFNAQMMDKMLELEQLAYNKYLNAENMKLNDLDVVQGQEDSDYGKYLTQLQQFNYDRDFDYQAYMDKYNRLMANVQTGSGLQEQKFNEYLAALDQYNTDRNFAYGQLLDEIDSQYTEQSAAMEKALTAAKYGDYSYLQALGINVNGTTGPKGQPYDPGSPDGGEDDGALTAEQLEALRKKADINNDGVRDTNHLASQVQSAQWAEILKNVSNEASASGVYVPGFGTLQWSQLRDYINRGLIIESTANGKTTYTKNPNAFK